MVTSIRRTYTSLRDPVKFRTRSSLRKCLSTWWVLFIAAIAPSSAVRVLTVALKVLLNKRNAYAILEFKFTADRLRRTRMCLLLQ